MKSVVKVSDIVPFIFSLMYVLWYTVSDGIYFCPVTTMILAELNMYLERIVAPFALIEWLV